MSSISASLTISLITFFVLGMTVASSSLFLSINFESALAQTDTLIQEDGKSNNNLSNNTLTYSYNIYSSNNDTQEAPTMLHNSSVSYYENNTTGYLVYPELANNTQQQQQQQQQQELMPAVIIIHEWFGLNEHIKNQADILAQEGYVVLAVDLYRGEVATDSNRAMELSSSVRNDPASAIDNLQSAVNYIKSLEIVDGSRIASLGWCFGGDWSLQLALNSSENPLAATVIYYGRPVTDTASLSSIGWPILGIFGDQDQSIPVESVKQFASALNASGVTNEIYLYEGVGHAFANPSRDNYAPKETTDAWQKTIGFLKMYL
ncbi:MAG TPA: dienelactone hydrolase family protein [Nitrososphaera sp.]|nr:dienelactone hydrolase family protein [Nitrososphaera sp.]